MNLATAKLSELYFLPKPTFRRPFCCSSSLRTNRFSKTENPRSRTSNSPNWVSKWPQRRSNSARDSPRRRDVTRPPPPPPLPENDEKAKYLARGKGKNAVDRIVLRLRNLGLAANDEEEEEENGEEERGKGQILTAVNGEERLSDLLKREWIRPDTILEGVDDDDEKVTLPWEREEKLEIGDEEEDGSKERKRKARAPTLAELTMEDEELRRLRKMGMTLRERINVPKAGITEQVLEKIHDKWRRDELVRLKFHEFLAHDMKTGHEIVELNCSIDHQRRTGGLVLWRAGSAMVVYRGSNYEGPKSRSQSATTEEASMLIPDVSKKGEAAMSDPKKTATSVMKPLEQAENLTEEEIEYNSLLDGLGPRYEAWWGTGVLPVDADLLPQKVEGYMTPFRLLPTGMRPRLTNAEMTNMRKNAKSLPCHFALGRNRHHQGLASAILKLWEKSLLVKIAVKRGIQNTNNKLMADELKQLTGGVLLLRNKYYIVLYRGKDFLPESVAAELAERQEITKQIQDTEEKLRIKLEAAASAASVEEDSNLVVATNLSKASASVEEDSNLVVASPSKEGDETALAGTLAEFYEAQARWGREMSTEEREKMVEEASKDRTARIVRRIEHKLYAAQAKKLRAEKLLSKIEASMVPADPDYDKETITDEERIMFRKIGLRMKPYLPIGIRGVFDGVIENMHLHWKYRELVKLITKQKTMTFVEDTARLLEYESGGILVTIERVSKGYALIYYRGKNYRRPISLRPRNLLTKAKALKRFVAMQRHEALSQHISELEQNIERLNEEIGISDDESFVNRNAEAPKLFDHNSNSTDDEDETSYPPSDDDEGEEEPDWNDDDFDFSDSENDVS
ncbi:CRM-domain containing factor CFM3, chloroplastic/mitochondrial [Linum perenne]